MPTRVVQAESLADILDQMAALAGRAGAVRAEDMVAAFGLSVMVRDGLLMLGAMALAGLAVGLLAWMA